MNIANARAGTSAEYTRRINKVLVYINKHLDQALQLDELAKVSHFSAYHFHRIFHAMIGETVNDYITRKRMEQALLRLIGQPTLSVTEVATHGGFSSSANFARAFKQYFGISPSECRDVRRGRAIPVKDSKIGKIYRKYGKVFNPHDLYSQLVTKAAVFEPDNLKEILMQVKVETIAEKPVVCLSSPQGYVLESVYATWEKLIQWADSHGIENDWLTRFALCHDNPAITPEDKCRYDATIVVDKPVEVAAPYHRSVLPGGKYAIAYYNGEARKINQFMTELCSQWLCDSGYEPDDYPPVFNYLGESDADSVEMNVYLKLKSLG